MPVTRPDLIRNTAPTKPLQVLVGLLLAALIAACGGRGVSSPQGDPAAAQRAAAAEGRQQQGSPPAAGRQVAQPMPLSGSDLGFVYQFILESYVDRVDHAGLIDAAATAVRESVLAAGVLPAETAPLDFLPLAAGNPERDWSAFGTAFDAVIQRHPEWTLQNRPDYAAVRRMVASLGDGHSNFLTASEARRRSIDTPQAEGQVLEPGLGYIRIRSFVDTTAERVGRLLLEQRQAGARSWIIDLRGNPGGNPTAVARVAGYFTEPRPIGITVDRAGQQEAIFAEQRPFLVRAPLVVLIDRDSHSAAEVLAATFKEYQLATLVGQKTAGSVGLAEARQLSDGSTVNVTVRRLLSASGAQLDRVGIRPDVEIGLTAQDLEAGRDPQRDAAVQLLRQRLAGA